MMSNKVAESAEHPISPELLLHHGGTALLLIKRSPSSLGFCYCTKCDLSHSVPSCLTLPCLTPVFLVYGCSLAVKLGNWEGNNESFRGAHDK